MYTLGGMSWLLFSWMLIYHMYRMSRTEIIAVLPHVPEYQSDGNREYYVIQTLWFGLMTKFPEGGFRIPYNDPDRLTKSPLW